nr:contact-dependent growth inhibition system immunity protein [Methylobacterium sp. OTU13CASTA1]
MNKPYPNMRYVLPAYFTQDFSLDYDNPFQAVDQIIHDNLVNPRLKQLRDEIEFIVKNENNIEEEFFLELGLDTVPFETSSDNRNLLMYFLKKIDDSI